MSGYGENDNQAQDTSYNVLCLVFSRSTVHNLKTFSLLSKPENSLKAGPMHSLHEDNFEERVGPVMPRVNNFLTIDSLTDRCGSNGSCLIFFIHVLNQCYDIRVKKKLNPGQTQS